MDPATALVARARDFALEHPSQARFATKLIQLIELIEAEFSGEARTQLLCDAREALERQQSVLQHTSRARTSLERIKQQQSNLLRTLQRLTLVRPPDSTLH